MLPFDFFAQPLESLFNLIFLIIIMASVSMLVNIAINVIWKQLPLNQSLSLSLSQLASLNFVSPVIAVVFMTTHKLSIVSFLQCILVGSFFGTFVSMTKVFLRIIRK